MNLNLDIKVGSMDERCLFEQNTQATNSFGEILPGTWTTVATVWGALNWDSVDEKEFIDRETEITKLKLITRYRSDIASSSYRVTIDSIVYNIEGYKILGRKRFLEFKLKALD